MIYHYVNKIMMSYDVKNIKNIKNVIEYVSNHNKIIFIKELKPSTSQWNKKLLGILLNKIKKNDMIIMSNIDEICNNATDILKFVKICMKKKVMIYLQSTNDIIDNVNTYHDKVIELIRNKYFNENIGFGKYKQTAIQLLKLTIQILDEFNIDYFLISGTLLGCMRHNDFIPWDDDMDLIVDIKILDCLDVIMKQYDEQLNFIKTTYLKFCFKNKDIVIDYKWKNYILDNNDMQKTYNFPFIDLFMFDLNDGKINFFKKQWDINQFYPKHKINFVGIENVCIPHNPEYFLKLNHGEDCLTSLRSSNYSHKEEKKITNKMTMLLDEYIKR